MYEVMEVQEIHKHFKQDFLILPFLSIHFYSYHSSKKYYQMILLINLHLMEIFSLFKD